MRPSIRERDDGKVDLVGVQVWGTGRYRGVGSPSEGDLFTERDLDSMVEAHNEVGERLDPRFYAGHPLTPALKQLARPKGKLANLRRYGSTLLADVVGVPLDFANRVVFEDDARLSPDMKVNHLDPVTGKTYPWAIVGLAALGAVQPGNSALPSLGAQLDPTTHYAFAAHCRSFYGGEENIRSFVIASDRFPATSLSYRRLRERLDRNK